MDRDLFEELRVLRMEIARRRGRFGRVVVLHGAKTPWGLLYPAEYGDWRAAGIEVLVAGDHGAMVFGDSSQLITALRNLLSNAVKFSPVGGEVRIEAEVLGEELRVLVRDRGEGIRAEDLPKLFHNPQARSWYETTPEQIRTTALRNATLQGAYLMIAARAIGLDVGAMSGFDNAKVDAAFFPDGRFKTNFLCNIGYGDPSKL